MFMTLGIVINVHKKFLVIVLLAAISDFKMAAILNTILAYITKSQLPMN